MAVLLRLFATAGSLLQMAAASPSSQIFFQAITPPPAVVENAVTEQFRQFHVGQPLTLPKTANQCVVEILHRNFANSYHRPEIVDYVPPAACGAVGSWAGIALNWTATSNGTQYDRLSGVTFHNVEIWRTSTSEPTFGGIIWTVLKDVTKYLPLFAKPGSFILDLNNLVDPKLGLTGEYNVRLSAIFYASDGFLHPKAPSADFIFPLSTLRDDDSNMFSVPPGGNSTVKFPRNMVSAFLEIQASGNYQEEFWYNNLPNKYLSDLPSGTTYGNGAFREVRVLVDGQLAGVAFPFATLFTGAWVPTIWRPVVAINAYDLPTYNIDLTPFVPLLTDGSNHTITLDISSDEPDHSVGPNWYLSGNVQVSTSKSSKPTTGKITSYQAPMWASTAHSATPGPIDGDWNFTVAATHNLRIEADVVSGDGEVNHVVWIQDLQFSNLQSYLDNTAHRILTQSAKGSSISTHNLLPVVTDQIDFPLSIDFAFVADETGSGWTTTFDHAYNRAHLPNPFQFFTEIKSWQHANGTYIQNPNHKYVRHANGSTENTFYYSDIKLNTYSRNVSTLNSTVTQDLEDGSLTWNWWTLTAGGNEDVQDMAQGLGGVGRLPGGQGRGC